MQQLYKRIMALEENNVTLVTERNIVAEESQVSLPTHGQVQCSWPDMLGFVPQDRLRVRVPWHSFRPCIDEVGSPKGS